MATHPEPGPLQVEEEELLHVLRRELGWHVPSLSRESIRQQDLIVVERLRLPESAPRPSLVLRVVPGHAAVDAPDSGGLHRALLAAGAPLPELHWCGPLNAGRCYADLLEDLERTGRVHDHEHTWSREEMLAIAEAFAAFHAAGIRVGRETLAARWPHLLHSPLHYADSEWIRSLPARLGHLPVHDDPARVRAVLARVGERYDAWLARLAPWQTVLQADPFWGNLAMSRGPEGAWRATLFDLEMATLGLPHYDMEYLTQRGFITAVPWDDVRRHHYETLTALLPDLVPEERVWWWGYRVGLLQLMLWGTWRAVGIIEQGEAASARDREWVRRSTRLFDPSFTEACRAALDEEPD